MHDGMQRPGTAGLLVRPLPRCMWRGDEPIRFGGKPRLGPGTRWPRDKNGKALHFVAEANLGRLPRSASGYPTPDFPKKGTLSLFLPLHLDLLYAASAVAVVFTPEHPSTLMECELPSDLADIGTMQSNLVHADGTTDNGRLLVRQRAEVLPFPSDHAVNRLALNMVEEAGTNIGPWKQANCHHEEGLAQALSTARPFPPFPNETQDSADLVNRIPKALREHLLELQARHLTWEFIFDWSKDFYDRCHDKILERLRSTHDAGAQGILNSTAIWNVATSKKKVQEHAFGEGPKPVFFAFDTPIAVTETFDRQAKRWMALAQFQTGPVSAQMLKRFVDMLVEIERHASKKDAHGNLLGPWLGLFDDTVIGHGLQADTTHSLAKMALQDACKRAVAREQQDFKRLDQDERWDRRIVTLQSQPAGPRFSPGTMPLQMFGLGFEIESSVRDHANDILLFQFGDSFGLPLEIGPDAVLQIWIKPEDLADGRFDRLECTMDTTCQAPPNRNLTPKSSRSL